MSEDWQVTVPFAGIVRPLVNEGDHVSSGQVVAILEAMKMESPITAPHAGTVTHLVIDEIRAAAGGDTLLTLSAAGPAN